MLALICGRGELPARIAAALPEPPLVCVLEGFAPDGLMPDLTFRLETLGSLLIDLGQRGVTDVCLCGAIDRPPLDPALLDAETAPLVPLLQEALTSGDDAALRAVMGLFENTGFVVRAAHDLAPDLVAPPGVLTEHWPDAQMRADAARGADILRALSPYDVGQACVIGAGQVLGIETIWGTDAMLWDIPKTPLRDGAILVKGAKTGQDLRADMPTIGPDTIQTVVAAGLRGLVIAAGEVLILDQDKTVAAADAAGLVLWSRTGE